MRGVTLQEKNSRERKMGASSQPRELLIARASGERKGTHVNEHLCAWFCVGYLYTAIVWGH